MRTAGNAVAQQGPMWTRGGVDNTTVAARVMTYVHPEVAVAMEWKGEVDAYADAVSKCCPWTWG